MSDFHCLDMMKRKRRPFSSREKNLIANTFKSLRQICPIETSNNGVAQNVAQSLGIHWKSVLSIVNELAEFGRPTSPKLKRLKQSAFQKIDDYTKHALRRKVHTCLDENPSLDKVLMKINEDPDLPNFRRTTLYRILKLLGFKYTKKEGLSLLENQTEMMTDLVENIVNPEPEITSSETQPETKPPLDVESLDSVKVESVDSSINDQMVEIELTPVKVKIERIDDGLGFDVGEEVSAIQIAQPEEGKESAFSEDTSLPIAHLVSGNFENLDEVKIHPVTPAKTTKPKRRKHACDISDYNTSTERLLMEHQASHTGDKPFQCPACPFKTTTSGYLVKHKLTHTDNKTYSCDKCQFKTTISRYLKAHLRTHMENNIYSCDICDFKTWKRRLLKVHMCAHSEQKPFACESCEYSTTRKSNFTVHLRTHTGEKPYACGMCEYKTSTKGNLKIHLHAFSHWRKTIFM